MIIGWLNTDPDPCFLSLDPDCQKKTDPSGSGSKNTDATLLPLSGFPVQYMLALNDNIEIIRLIFGKIFKLVGAGSLWFEPEQV